MSANSTTQRFLVYLAAAGLSLLLQCCSEAQTRTWTDSTGAYKIRAKLVLVHEVSGELQAELLQADGKRMAIPISKLSQNDRVLAEEFHLEWINGGSSSKPKALSEVSESVDLNSKTSVDKIVEALSKKNVRIPEEGIVSRPLRSPLNSELHLEGPKSVTVKFDPETAVRLEREIERDEKGRALKNPKYTVEVDQADLDSLPLRYRQIAMLLNDESRPIDLKRREIEKFTDDWPQRRYPALISVLVNCLSDDDKFLRLAALDLLAKHDSEKNIHYILARIDDVSFDVRWRTYEVLAQIRDPRIIPELCERLGTADCRKIASVLQVFGSTSNPWIHPWLEQEDLKEDYMLEICKILCVTGDFDSVQALSRLNFHKSKLVQRQANYAVQQIEKRLKATAAR